MTAVKQLEAEQAVARAVLGDRPERPNGYVLPVVFTLGVALCCLFGEKAIDQPLRWKKPRRIFVNSMSDLFHESLPDEWIDRVFGVVTTPPAKAGGFSGKLGRNRLASLPKVVSRPDTERPPMHNLSRRNIARQHTSMRS